MLVLLLFMQLLLDGAEGIRGLGVSWMNRGEGGDDGVRGVVFLGDEG